MAKDVFISYSSKDKVIADLVCEILEQAGLRCWIAPRDVTAGCTYAESIIDGIDASRLVVLIFSAAANRSEHVLREVDRAVNQKVPIVTFRIQNVDPSKSMVYYLGVKHWLDAFEPPLEPHFVGLVQTVLKSLGERPEPAKPPAVPDAVASVSDAIAVVDSINIRLQKTGEAFDLESAEKIMATAIHFGAPIYNAGSPAGCAEIYLHAAREILEMLNRARAQPGAAPCSPRLLRVCERLRAIVSHHPTVTAQNADALAWALREAFDQTALLSIVEQGIRKVDQCLAEAKARGGPLSFSDLCAALQLAIAHGNAIYEDEIRGCAELHWHTARTLLTHLAQAPATNGTGVDGRLAATQRKLEAIIREEPQVTVENAQALAWRLYEAFLEILQQEDK